MARLAARLFFPPPLLLQPRALLFSLDFGLPPAFLFLSLPHAAPGQTILTPANLSWATGSNVGSIVASFLGGHRTLSQQDRGVHPRNHQVPKLVGDAIVSSRMPAKPAVDQRERYNLPLGGPMVEGMVGEPHRLLLMDRARDDGEHGQSRLIEP